MTIAKDCEGAPLHVDHVHSGQRLNTIGVFADDDFDLSSGQFDMRDEVVALWLVLDGDGRHGVAHGEVKVERPTAFH